MTVSVFLFVSLRPSDAVLAGHRAIIDVSNFICRCQNGVANDKKKKKKSQLFYAYSLQPNRFEEGRHCRWLWYRMFYIVASQWLFHAAAFFPHPVGDALPGSFKNNSIPSISCWYQPTNAEWREQNATRGQERDTIFRKLYDNFVGIYYWRRGKGRQ